MTQGGVSAGISGKARGFVTPRGAAVAGTLHAQWGQRYAATTSEQDLPAAIDALMDHAVRTGALFERTASMRVERRGQLEALLAPDRHARGPEQAPAPGACSCPFCAPPNPNAKAIRFRNWDLLPNAFPYARLHSQHFLAARSTHEQQHFSAAVLDDMIDLHTLLDGKSRTFHYNGWAGNTQPHLHWQITKERFAIEQAVEHSTPLRTTPKGRVCSFDDGTLSGIVVQGQKAFVVNHTAAIIAGLLQDPTTRDRYNLLILPSPSPQADTRVVVIPRRADALVVECGNGSTSALSAVEVAGRFIFSGKDALPDTFTENSAREGLRQTVVRAEELPWLKTLVSAPLIAQLVARAHVQHARTRAKDTTTV